MRIIGGKLKGKPIVSPENDSIRPTSDRLRETIFNVLMHKFNNQIVDARVLDLFSGTGALGFEALSRGAAQCLFVDSTADARAIIRTNVENFGLTGITKIFRRDATKLGNIEKFNPFDLIFLDPPYNKGLGELALESAKNGGWLKSEAICVLEESSDSEIEIPEDFEVIDKRCTGNCKTVFLRYGN